MIDLPGTETLNKNIGEITDLAGTSVSIVSYIRSNTILPDAGDSAIFKKFTDFVHGMLMVRSIEGTFMLDWSSPIKVYAKILLREERLKNLKDFSTRTA